MLKDDARKCPRCKLVNLPSAEYCDCGYKFNSVAIDEQKAHIFDKERRKKGLKMIIGGVGSLVLGIILTAVSFFVSTGIKWGFYVAFTGLISGGAIVIWRGVILIIGERK